MSEALLLHPWIKVLIYKGIVVLGLGQAIETATRSLSDSFNLLVPHCTHTYVTSCVSLHF